MDRLRPSTLIHGCFKVHGEVPIVLCIFVDPIQLRKNYLVFREWVNLSKRGGKDGVFQGLAGLLRGISRGRSPREIPRSSPASPRKTLSFLTLFSQIYILFLIGFRMGPPKMHRRFRIGLPKCTDGSVLALLNPYWPY